MVDGSTAMSRLPDLDLFAAGSDPPDARFLLPLFCADPPFPTAVYFTLTHFDRSISPPCFIPKCTARPCLFRFTLSQLGQSYLKSGLSAELNAASIDCFRPLVPPALSLDLLLFGPRLILLADWRALPALGFCPPAAESAAVAPVLAPGGLRRVPPPAPKSLGLLPWNLSSSSRNMPSPSSTPHPCFDGRATYLLGGDLLLWLFFVEVRMSPCYYISSPLDYKN